MHISIERWPLRTLFAGAVLLNTACATDLHGFDSITPFEEVTSDFTHNWDETVHPFSGAAVLDVDGDGRMEVFVGGGNQQPDLLLRLRNGVLEDVIDEAGLSSLAATYGSVSIDIDDDADVDLLVARQDGVTLYLNDDGRFTPRQIPVDLPDDSVVLSIAAGDIDRDGDADLYLSVFIDFAAFRSAVFNDPEHARANILLLNNGDLSFTDITKASGTAGKQNSFLSVFTDLDNDGWQDLVVAQNTGEVEMFRNNRDRSFTAVPTDSGFGFWMGIAVGDMDNDGDQDLYFSNVGDSIPAFLTTGDLQDDQRHNLEWLLLRNDGNFQFSDATADYGITGEGFAWGAVFEDLNLDGRLDLAVAQNYIKWPVHKLFKLSGRTYLQTGSAPAFTHIEALGIENPYFGQSPVIADLDADGKPDLLWINMDGPVRALLNRTPGASVTVKVEDHASLLGTRVRLTTSAGESYTREVVTSVGLMTDQTPDLVFGLGDATAERIEILYPDGSRDVIESPGDTVRLQRKTPP